MTKARIRLEIDLDMRRKFKGLCGTNGTTMSAELRKFIAFCVDNEMLPPDDAIQEVAK